MSNNNPLGSLFSLGVMGVIGWGIYAANAPADTIQMPERQAQLVNVVAQYQDAYRKASNDRNDLQMNTLADARSKVLCNLAKADAWGEAWLGEVYRVSTGFSRGNESASLTVKVGGGRNTFWLETRNDIKVDEPVFAALQSLNRGDKIRFSGHLFVEEHTGNKGNGCLREFSISQNGSMTDPEFAFRFTAIERR